MRDFRFALLMGKLNEPAPSVVIRLFEFPSFISLLLDEYRSSSHKRSIYVGEERFQGTSFTSAL